MLPKMRKKGPGSGGQVRWGGGDGEAGKEMMPGLGVDQEEVGF